MKCPFCAELIPQDALICGFCRSDLTTSPVWAARVRESQLVVKIVLIMIGCVIAWFAWRYVKYNYLYNYFPHPDEQPGDTRAYDLSPELRARTIAIPPRAAPAPLPAATSATAAAPVKSSVNATPHPAREAAAEALRLYPSLGQKGSPINTAFVRLYQQAEKDDPQILSDPNWPLRLANEAFQTIKKAPAMPPSH